MGRKSNAKKNRTTPSVGQQRRTYLRELPEKLRLEAERKEHERDQRIAGQIRTETWRRTFCCGPSPHEVCRRTTIQWFGTCPRRAHSANDLPFCYPMPLTQRWDAGDAPDTPADDSSIPYRRSLRGAGRSLGALLALAAASGALSVPSPGPYRGPGR